MLNQNNSEQQKSHPFFKRGFKKKANNFFEWADAHSADIGVSVQRLDYITGTTFSTATAPIANKIPPVVSTSVIVSWNYLDAIFAFYIAIRDLRDKDNYRQTQAKIKGILGIISSLQSFGLSYIPGGIPGLGGATVLAAPAFAASVLADTAIAAMDFYNATKEMEFEGWFEERLKEISFVAKRIKEEENNSDKKSELSKRYTQLTEDMGARARIYCNGGDNLEKKNKINEKIDLYITTPLDNITKQNFKLAFTDRIKKGDMETDQQIQERLKKNYKEKREQLILKSMSFIGMALLAISPFAGPAAPGLLIAGLIITSLVSIYDAKKMAPYVIAGAKSAIKHTKTFCKSQRHVFFGSRDRTAERFAVTTNPEPEPATP